MQHRRRHALATVLVLSSCGSTPPPEPSDVDLATARAGFRCGAAASPDAVEACRVIDAFAAAGPVTSFPTGDEVQIWLGVDHCVQPTATPAFATYQLVYLRAGAGSPPLSASAAARTLPYSAVFGSDQVNVAGMPDLAAALASLVRDERPASDVWRGSFPTGDGAYRTLVRTLSGTSVGDDTADTGIWFLRSDGTHLLLVGPTIQGGCASELHRVPL